MPNIILVKSFKGDLNKIKSVQIDHIVREVRKYDKGLKNLVDLYSPAKGMKLLKGYLDSKKVRFVVLLVIDKLYIPCFIEKKESKYGYNVSKDSLEKLLTKKSELVINDLEGEKNVVIEL